MSERPEDGGIRVYRVHKVSGGPHQVANALNNRRELTPIAVWIQNTTTWMLTVEVVHDDRT